MHSTLESIHNIRLRVLTSYYSGSTLEYVDCIHIILRLVYESYNIRAHSSSTSKMDNPATTLVLLQVVVCILRARIILCYAYVCSMHIMHMSYTCTY